MVTKKFEEESYTAILKTREVRLSNVVTLEDAILHSRALFGKEFLRVEHVVRTTTYGEPEAE